MLKALGLLRTDRATGNILLDIPDLEFAPGEYVGIRGPSGSGKSLLLRALAWLDRLDRGELRYRGLKIHHDAVPEYRRRVMYLHQTASLDGAKIEDVLRRPFGLQVHRHSRYERPRAVQLLASLGRKEDFLTKNVRDLSGGEKQISALLRALLLEPEILMLDEPTAALDKATTRQVETVVSNWVKERPDRRLILWVSHDEHQTERLATRVIRVEAGRVKE